ncbi:transmembrane 45B-like, partial [Brachionus plicatilis]
KLNNLESDKIPQSQMGSLAGHLLPGTFFILFAVWWSFVTAIRYIQSKHYLSAKKSKANYVSQTTMPCICLPSESLRRSPVESCFKLTAGLIGILGELVTAIDFNHVVEPGIGKDDVSIFGCDNQSSHVHMHKRGTHPQIQPFYFARNNLQHITMYSGFVLQALVEILLFKGFNLPKRSDFYFGLIAYSIEAFLFAFHLHSRAPMDIHVHVLLVYAIFGCCLSICLEIYNPHQLCFLNKFYYSSKRVRDRFDELILIQDEWERKSVQLQTAQNGLSETRFFMLDSDEDEVYDNNNSSPVSSTTSGNYSAKSSQMSNSKV